MKRSFYNTSILTLVILFQSLPFAATIQMSPAMLQDKINGGWLGKTAGVCIGAPTEFAAQNAMYTGGINLYPDLYGGFGQDDIYVQVTFISAMDAVLSGPKGVFEATQIDYGNAFKNSTYALWWANDKGRSNIRAGILPPLSGMWAGTGKQYNNVSDAIDFQIECDWIGIMCPAMPLTAVRICDSVGHVMNYGDGLYGGYFISAMDALAFQYNDIHTIVKEALKCIPDQSDYAAIIRDVIAFHDNNPSKTYADCWQAINTKWLHYQSNPCIQGEFNILASFNGALIAIGLLYGDNDILKAVEYSCRGGQDSDCNPANAGAIMGIMLGYNALPAAWRSANTNGTYASSTYTYAQTLASHLKRAKMAIVQMGGDTAGATYTIQVEAPAQPQYWERFGFDPVPIDTNLVKASINATPLKGAFPLTVTFNASSSIGRNLSSWLWSFGDGATATGATASHTYTQEGSFAVRLIIGNSTKSDTASIIIQATDPAKTPLKKLGTPIVSVTAPTGQGSKDIEIIRDDVYPATGNYGLGFDTYNGQQHTEDYFGYTFAASYSFTSLTYQLAAIDPDLGGAFQMCRVQVLQGTTWVDVTGLQSTPAYASATAKSFGSYTFLFTPMSGTGIRIIGAPGDGQWVGCAELDVEGAPAGATAMSRRQGAGSVAPRLWYDPSRGISFAQSPGTTATSVAVMVFDGNGKLIGSARMRTESGEGTGEGFTAAGIFAGLRSGCYFARVQAAGKVVYTGKLLVE